MAVGNQRMLYLKHSFKTKMNINKVKLEGEAVNFHQHILFYFYDQVQYQMDTMERQTIASPTNMTMHTMTLVGGSSELKNKS